MYRIHARMLPHAPISVANIGKRSKSLVRLNTTKLAARGLHPEWCIGIDGQFRRDRWTVFHPMQRRRAKIWAPRCSDRTGGGEGGRPLNKRGGILRETGNRWTVMAKPKAGLFQKVNQPETRSLILLRLLLPRPHSANITNSAVIRILMRHGESKRENINNRGALFVRSEWEKR